MARPCGAGFDRGAHETGPCGPDSPRFRRGDANADGVVNLSDAVFTLDALFRGGPQPGCADAADAHDDGSLSITDAIFLLNHLFRGGPAPQPPNGDACGSDPTQDEIECAAGQPGC